MTKTQALITDTAIAHGWTTRDPKPAEANLIAWKRGSDTVIVDFGRKGKRLTEANVLPNGANMRGANLAARIVAVLAA